MIKRARILNKKFKTEITFEVEDATVLSFSNDSFDGAIFGFNGLMQIPDRKNRFQAMKEVQRVLKPKFFCFYYPRPNDAQVEEIFWALERKMEKRRTEPRTLRIWGPL